MEVKKRILALPVVAVLALAPACAQAHSDRTSGKSFGAGTSSTKDDHKPMGHGAGRRVH